MKTKEFDKVKPYCYILTRLSDGKKYFGVRTQNVKKNRSPKEDFGKYYFTSSRTFKKEFKKKPEDFKFLLHSTFHTIKEALSYEHYYNKNYTVYSDLWINRAAWPAIIQTEESKKKISEANKGRKLTDYQKQKIIHSNKTRVYGPETLEKISKINKGRKFPKEFREKISKSKMGKKLSKKHKKNIGLGVRGEKNGMFGKTHSFKVREKLSTIRIGKRLTFATKDKISKSLIGKMAGEKNPMFGKPAWNRGKSRSEETKMKISLTKKGTIPWNKGKKGVQIPWNKGLKLKQINERRVNV